MGIVSDGMCRDCRRSLVHSLNLTKDKLAAVSFLRSDRALFYVCNRFSYICHLVGESPLDTLQVARVSHRHRLGGGNSRNPRVGGRLQEIHKLGLDSDGALGGFGMDWGGNRPVRRTIFGSEP